jgi:hypothetical protein
MIFWGKQNSVIGSARSLIGVSAKILGFMFLMLLLLISTFIMYSSRSDIQQGLFNSDALYLPALFSDIFTRGGHIRDWFLTPAPYFFPDFPMFYLAYLIGSSVYSQIITFALIQIVLSFFAIWYLMRVIGVTHSLSIAAATTSILTWFALSAREPFSLTLNSAFHYGAFLSAVVLSALWIQFYSGAKVMRKGRLLFLMIIISYLTSLSDNLFLVQAIAPLVATHMLCTAARREFSIKNTIFLASVVIFGVLGSASYKLIVENPVRYPMHIGIKKILLNAQEVYRLIGAEITQNMALFLILLFYMGIVIYSVIEIIRRKDGNYKLNWLAVFSFISFCATIFTVMIVENLPVTLRYFIPTFIWPLIVVLAFLGNWLRDRSFYIATTVSLLTVTTMSWQSYHFYLNNKISKEYYPEQIACIDRALAEYNHNNGVTQYWDAKYLIMFSKTKANFAQYYENMNEMHWITSRKYFKENYDFAITSEAAVSPHKISSDALIRINGAPTTVKVCGHRSVFIYGKDKLRLRKIVAVGDSYTWQGCELPSIIGEKTEQCAMRRNDAAPLGYLTFGPYEPLPAGQYTFELVYVSAASSAEVVGEWDVALTLANEARILTKGLITGTDAVLETLSANFSVDAKHHLQKIQIRTLAQANLDLKVIHLKIDRVQ